MPKKANDSGQRHDLMRDNTKAFAGTKMRIIYYQWSKKWYKCKSKRTKYQLIIDKHTLVDYKKRQKFGDGIAGLQESI